MRMGMHEIQKNKKSSLSVLIIAPLIVFTLYLIQLVINGIFPFGENTVASYDLSAQIVPFIEHLFDVLDGKSTLEYSYAIAGGADVTGTFLYFFLSPFSFLFLVFGDGNVAHATCIVMLAKLSTIAFIGAWFSRKLFRNIPDYICIAVGVTYTFCGYTFVANTYINWMDFLIYAPLGVGAFTRYVKTGKYLTFSVVIACCIYTCFSIACFSLFTVFPLLIVYALLCVEKSKRNKFISYLCLSFVIAILFSLPVLLPALHAFLNSARGGGLFENIWKYYDTIDGALGGLNKGDFIKGFFNTAYKKWSYILSDGIFVVLALVWFYRQDRERPFVRFMEIAGVVTLLPTLVDEAMLLLNMGSYMEYSLRFGFLNALYFLGIACLCLDELFERKENLSLSKNEAGRYALSLNKGAIVFMLVSAVCIVGILVFVTGERYKNDAFWGLFFKTEQALKNLKGLSASFAHTYGGLEMILVLLVPVVVLTGLAAVFIAKKQIRLRLASWAILVLVGIESAFYCNQLIVGNLSSQHRQINAYKSITATLNQMDDGYFRIKDYGELITRNEKEERECIWTANVPFTANSNAFSVFSSVIDKDNFIVGNLFGYLNNGKNIIKSTHNTHSASLRADVFGDSFLGYKYFIVPQEQVSTVEKLRYIKKVMVETENGAFEHLKVENSAENRTYYAYENTAVFPLAYKVNDKPFRFVTQNTMSSSNRKKNQAALYEFLRGKNLFATTNSDTVTTTAAINLSEYLQGKSAQIQLEAGKITATVTAEENESLFLNFVASKGYTVKVNGKKAELIDNDLKFLQVKLEKGENRVEFVYHSPYKTYALQGGVWSIIGLVSVYLIVKKTKFMQVLQSVIAWAGIGLTMAVLAFFFLFPTCVWLVKWIYFLL